jgi:hypothetical protein
MSLHFPPMPPALDIEGSGIYPLDQSQYIRLNLPADAQTMLSIDNSEGNTGPFVEFLRQGGSEHSTRQSQPGPDVYNNRTSYGNERQHNGRVNPGPSDQGSTWHGSVATGNSFQHNGNVYGDVVDGNVQSIHFQNSRHSAGNHPHGPTQPHILNLRLPGQNSLRGLSVKAAGVDFLSTPEGFNIEDLEIVTAHAPTKYGEVMATQTTMENGDGKCDARGLQSENWTYYGGSGCFESQTGSFIYGRASTTHGSANLHVPDDPCFRILDVDTTHGKINVSSSPGNRSSVGVRTKHGKVRGNGERLGTPYTKAATGPK